MKLSQEKKQKISEQILAILFSNTPNPIFTSLIARESARDEEFIKQLLLDMKKQNLVVEIKKNPKGEDYLRRSRWKLTDVAYLAYKRNQTETLN